MGNHRAERGPRRAPSEVRAPRKPLVTRHSATVTHAATPVAAPSAAAVEVSTAPATPAASRPGKRAARPEPKRAARSLSAPKAARPARVSRPAVERTPVLSPASRPGPVRVASSSTEILTPSSGRRRAARTSTSDTRGAFLKALPSAPIMAGVAALAVSAGGALTMAGPTAADAPHSPTSGLSAAAAVADTGVEEILAERTGVVSRDSNRIEAAQRVEAKLVEKAEKAAAQRSKALETLTVQADRQAAKIEANQWVMPLDGYRLSATFGMSSSLWSTVHTGLDFAAPSGTPLRAVANGTITEVGYDGSYGNKTVLTLEDGTEIWYCHQTSMNVSVGSQVVGGEVIGTVGSTGNSTGPHLHLEIRPEGGGPVDPYSGLLDHGLQP